MTISPQYLVLLLLLWVFLFLPFPLPSLSAFSLSVFFSLSAFSQAKTPSTGTKGNPWQQLVAKIWICCCFSHLLLRREICETIPSDSHRSVLPLNVLSRFPSFFSFSLLSSLSPFIPLFLFPTSTCSTTFTTFDGRLVVSHDWLWSENHVPETFWCDGFHYTNFSICSIWGDISSWWVYFFSTSLKPGSKKVFWFKECILIQRVYFDTKEVFWYIECVLPRTGLLVDFNDPVTQSVTNDTIEQFINFMTEKVSPNVTIGVEKISDFESFVAVVEDDPDECEEIWWD